VKLVVRRVQERDGSPRGHASKLIERRTCRAASELVLVTSLELTESARVVSEPSSELVARRNVFSSKRRSSHHSYVTRVATTDRPGPGSIFTRRLCVHPFQVDHDHPPALPAIPTGPCSDFLCGLARRASARARSSLRPRRRARPQLIVTVADGDIACESWLRQWSTWTERPATRSNPVDRSRGTSQDSPDRQCPSSEVHATSIAKTMQRTYLERRGANACMNS